MPKVPFAARGKPPCVDLQGGFPEAARRIARGQGASRRRSQADGRAGDSEPGDSASHSARGGGVMINDTVDDPKSRGSIARFEAEDFRRRISGVSFVGAAFWVAAMVAAWRMGVSLHWLVIGATGATILSMGALVADSSNLRCRLG